MELTQRDTAISLRFNPGEAGPNRSFRATDDTTGGYIDGTYIVTDGQIYATLTYGKEATESETISFAPNSHIIPDKNHITSVRIGEVENLFLWFMDLIELRQANLVNQESK